MVRGHNSLPRDELEKVWLPSFVGSELSFWKLDSALVVLNEIVLKANTVFKAKSVVLCVY